MIPRFLFKQVGIKAISITKQEIQEKGKGCRNIGDKNYFSSGHTEINKYVSHLCKDVQSKIQDLVSKGSFNPDVIHGEVLYLEGMTSR